ncbi:hypothetical protein MRB53_040120 [Persea americana]|nr:hypothetical protein MRB53_040120 [Persea americana]
MIDAFGTFGVEGPFRKCCEITMELLRSNEDGLMTILETFLHDPTTDFMTAGKRRKARADGRGLDVPDTAEKMLDAVRGKVRGMLKGESVPLSVGGYVEEMIKQASDRSNLAQMYIGCSSIDALDRARIFSMESHWRLSRDEICALNMTALRRQHDQRAGRIPPNQASLRANGDIRCNDAAPEFEAKVLPAGSAPADRTFKPNPINEIPGQANNPDVPDDQKADPLDFPGATSGDVHTGLGHPGQGMSSAELHHDGKSDKARDRSGLTKTALGGSGLTGEPDAAAQKLMQDHEPGMKTEKEQNVSLDGAESREHVHAEQLQSEAGKVNPKKDYDHTAESAPGAHS